MSSLPMSFDRRGSPDRCVSTPRQTAHPVGSRSPASRTVYAPWRRGLSKGCCGTIYHIKNGKSKPYSRGIFQSMTPSSNLCSSSSSSVPSARARVIDAHLLVVLCRRSRSRLGNVLVLPLLLLLHVGRCSQCSLRAVQQRGRDTSGAGVLRSGEVGWLLERRRRRLHVSLYPSCSSRLITHRRVIVRVI